jgi:tetratricopeptide (TPR) repeat protein
VGGLVVRYVDFLLQFFPVVRGSRAGLALVAAVVLLAAALLLCTYAWLRRRRVRAHAPDDDAELSPASDSYDPAVAPLDDALAADPLSVDKRRERGLYHLQKGEYDLAIQDFHVWVAQAPKAADAYRCRGDAWRKLGFDDLALADYLRALRLEPSNAGAREGFKALLPPPAPGDRPAPAPSVPSLTALFAREMHVATPIAGRPAAKDLHSP